MKNLIFPILTLSVFATTSVHSRETPYYTALTPQGKVRNHRYSIEHSKSLSNLINKLLLDRQQTSSATVQLSTGPGGQPADQQARSAQPLGRRREEG